MKQLLTLAALFSTLTCTTANAASIEAVSNFADNVHSIYLKGGSSNGRFDVIDFQAVPTMGGMFLDTDNAFDRFFPFPPGLRFTYINEYLGASLTRGGEGFTVLGAATTPAKLTFAAGPLGQTIDTGTDPGGRLFLANFHVPPGQFVNVMIDLYSQGTLIESIWFPVPEPDTWLMAFVGLNASAMIVVYCRRR